MSSLRIAVWNANGLAQHILELVAFIADQKIDIMLISETHFTEKSYVCVPNYTIYNTNHPAKTARGGSAIIVKNNIAHTHNKSFCEDHIQATSITIIDTGGKLTISALYCPPRHTIKNEQFCNFYKTLGDRFIAAGDYNAKHTIWGSRIITPKGRELFKAMLKMNLSHVSTGNPTYWPSDRNKLPDVIDFCITRGISTQLMSAKSSHDLSSDHTPIIITLDSQIQEIQNSAFLHSKNTIWTHFKTTICENLCLNLSLKNGKEIESAIEHFNTTIQHAAWNATPPSKCKRELPNEMVASMLRDKRKLRKRWQNTRDPEIKTQLNKASKDLKSFLQEMDNTKVSKYLENLSATKASDYSLWKATKKMYKQTPFSSALKTESGDWAKTDREKATTFANHLSEVFKPFPRQVTEAEESLITRLFPENTNSQYSLPPVSISEVTVEIKKLNIKKAAGYDLITPKALKELPDVGVRFITFIFNAIIRTKSFPLQWKLAQILMIHKPGKSPDLSASYRPISLLPVLSKVFETLILKRLLPIIIQLKIIPDHQFGFRQHHSTIEQVNRVYQIARNAIEHKKYCTAAFLDVSQAFDKVWHHGLLCKLKSLLPAELSRLLCSYLSQRFFMVKVKSEISELLPIESGVPQGSVLGPVLYTIFTADLPLDERTYTATFADDTVVMAVHNNVNTASQLLQLKLWRIKANDSKSTHFTFSLRKDICPKVMFNNNALPQSTEVKYLGIHLDKRLTWQHHIFSKRKQLGLKLRSLHWLLQPSSKLTLQNKVLIYKVIIKPIWTYGIQLWGSAAQSNIAIIERFQSKTLRLICNAPRCVNNRRIREDLNISTVKDVVSDVSTNYKNRLLTHQNPLARDLILANTELRRLQRFHPLDLPDRFL